MADHQDHHDHHHQGFEVHQVKHDDGSHVYHGIDITKINISSLPKSQQVSCCGLLHRQLPNTKVPFVYPIKQEHLLMHEKHR